jgi:hypothetical protein
MTTMVIKKQGQTSLPKDKGFENKKKEKRAKMII